MAAAPRASPAPGRRPSRPVAVRASRSPRTGSPRARARGALDALLRALDELAGAARLSRRGPGRAARARAVARRRARGRAHRAPRALRAQRGARRRPDRGHARVARGGRRRAAQQGVGRALADAQRHLASIYELRGDRERALAARRVAADSFATNGLPGEAAAERLVVAGYLQSAGKHGEAVALARVAAGGGPAGRASRSARPRPRPRGRGDGQGRRARRRRRDGPRRPLARAGP